MPEYEIELILDADTSQANKQLGGLAGDFDDIADKGKRAGGKLGGVFDEIRGKIQGAVSQIPIFGGALSKLASGPIGLAIGAVAGLAIGLGKLIDNQRNAAREIENTSKQLGISTDAVQRYTELERTLGIETNALADAQYELNNRLGEIAKDGTGPAVTALEHLGLSYQHLASLAPEQQFLLVRDALSQVADVTHRTFLAEELLGGNAEKLRQLTDLKTDAFDRAYQQSQKGVTLTATQIDGYGQLTDMIAKVTGGIKQGFSRALASLLPHLLTAIQETTRFYNDSIKPLIDAIADLWQEIDQYVIPVLQLVGTVIGQLVSGAFTTLVDVLRLVTALLRGDWAAAWNAAKTLVVNLVRRMVELVDTLTGGMASRLISLIGDMVSKVGGLLTAMRDAIVQAIADFRDKAIGAVTDLRNKAVAVINAMRTAIVGAFDAMRKAMLFILKALVFAIDTLTGGMATKFINLVIDMAGKVIARITELRDKAVAIFTAIRDKVVSLVSAMRDRVVNIVRNLRDRIVGMIKGARDSIVGTFNDAKNKVVSVWLSMWDAMRGKFEPVLAPVRAALNTIKSIIETVIGSIRTLTSSVSSALSAAQSASGAVSGAISNVTGAFSNVGGKIDNAFSGIGGGSGSRYRVRDKGGGLYIDGISRAEAERIAKQRGGTVESYAQGGIIPATVGGRLIRVAEAGQAEAVIPLDKLRGIMGGMQSKPQPVQVSVDATLQIGRYKFDDVFVETYRRMQQQGRV